MTPSVSSGNDDIYGANGCQTAGLSGASHLDGSCRILCRAWRIARRLKSSVPPHESGDSDSFAQKRSCCRQRGIDGSGRLRSIGLLKQLLQGAGICNRDMPGEPLGKLGKLWALGHEPGLEGELDQDADASVVGIALNETVMRIRAHEVGEIYHAET